MQYPGAFLNMLSGKIIQAYKSLLSYYMIGLGFGNCQKFIGELNALSLSEVSIAPHKALKSYRIFCSCLVKESMLLHMLYLMWE